MTVRENLMLNLITTANQISNSPKPLSALNFKGVNHPAELQSDEFVKEGDDKEKKMSKGKLAAIIGGVVAFGGIIAAAILCKGKTLQPANFAEHIEFVKANTMEEAIGFAKKHFGIENFNLGDDLELANWVNEGLVKINNRFKGKANMPKQVILDEAYFAKNPDACAYHSERKHTIGINKKYFDGAIDKFKSLLEEGKKASEKIASSDGDGTMTTREYALSLLNTPIKYIDETHFQFENLPNLDYILQAEILTKVEKFKNAPEQFSRFDAANALMMIQDLEVSALRFATEPITIIKDMFKKAPEFFSQKGKTIEEFEKLSNKELHSTLTDLIHEYNNANPQKPYSIAGTHRGNSKFDILWHEMGHLLHDMNTALKDSFWGVLSKKSYKDFKNDSEKQHIAGLVSLYGQTNPKEFVAECFQAMCAGRKLPKEVMEQYKFYKGPMLPEME